MTAQADGSVRGLHNQLVEELGRQIAAGELREEEQIVPEDLGARFGVSRPVVREALRSLEAKGMVHPRPRTGTRVLARGQWNLLDPDVIRWRVSGPDGAAVLAELGELRAGVEMQAVRLSAERASTAHLSALNQACDAMAAAATSGDLSGFTDADIAYHAVILEASGNPVFAQFASPFAAFLQAREDLHTLPERLGEAVVEDHRAILAALEATDPDLAEQRLRALVQRAGQEISQSISRLAH